MTFSEALNLRSCNIDIATGKSISHKEIYTRAINACGGLDAIIPFIPFSLESIKQALANGDEYLNTLPLTTWDSVAHNIRGLCYYKAKINCMSLSQGVCLLKEAARQWALRETDKECHKE